MAVAAALLVGFGLRLYFAWRFPFHSGDSVFYKDLALVWLGHGTYGLYSHGQLFAEDVRVPGYPAFLAAIYAIFGVRDFAVGLAQGLVDLATCVAAALLARELSPGPWRTRVFLAGLWLAAVCPFTANYTAAILTETLATFLTALALLALAAALRKTGPCGATPGAARWWFAGGLLAGAGALVRPETPLLLVPFVLVLFFRSARRRAWRPFLAFSLSAAAGLAVCLSPWAARNALVLGRAQFLAPRYAETHGDYIPRGFYAWTQTWVDRYRYAYLVTWKVNRQPLDPAVFPDRAFDSPEERARVQALVARHNQIPGMTPEIDRQFDQLARERRARHPARTFLVVPFKRMLALWFTPRTELLRFEDVFWPPAGEPWNGRPGFPWTGILELLQVAYAALGIAGAWRLRSNPLAQALVLFILFRTILMTGLQTVEPRYVLECFPALVALGAQVLASGRAGAPATPGEKERAAP